VGFPGLRVGWIAAPRTVIEHLNIVKQNSDLHASLLTQAAIYEFSRRGLLAKHIRRVRKEYARRRDVMLAAMETHFPSEITWNQPKGGMAIWATLPASLSSSEILIHAAERGVVFSPGEHFYPGSARRNLLRLCFTMSSAPAIGEGIKRLGAVIKERIMIQKKSKVRKTAGLRALV
jgi:2-aminoadipate transaminase